MPAAFTSQTGQKGDKPWFPGDVAVVTSRDGHAFAGEVAGLDVCTGEVTIKLPGS